MNDNNWLDRSIPEPNSGCWIWLGAVSSSSGYGNIGWRIKGKQYHTSAHRKRWAEEYGDPGSCQVRHKCGNKLCVNLSHLAIGTQSENEQDKKRHGTANYYGSYAKRKGRRWVTLHER